jgi:hypothetical protein
MSIKTIIVSALGVLLGHVQPHRRGSVFKHHTDKYKDKSYNPQTEYVSKPFNALHVNLCISLCGYLIKNISRINKSKIITIFFKTINTRVHVSVKGDP